MNEINRKIALLLNDYSDFIRTVIQPEDLTISEYCTLRAAAISESRNGRNERPVSRISPTPMSEDIPSAEHPLQLPQSVSEPVVPIRSDMGIADSSSPAQTSESESIPSARSREEVELELFRLLKV